MAYFRAPEGNQLEKSPLNLHLRSSDMPDIPDDKN